CDHRGDGGAEIQRGDANRSQPRRQPVVDAIVVKPDDCELFRHFHAKLLGRAMNAVGDHVVAAEYGAWWVLIAQQPKAVFITSFHCEGAFNLTDRGRNDAAVSHERKKTFQAAATCRINARPVNNCTTCQPLLEQVLSYSATRGAIVDPDKGRRNRRRRT